jgi:hypothetical protein
MERARQMRRDLITVAVVAVLLGAAMLLISSSAAFAHSAVEDQYSNATSDHYADVSSPSASASASASTAENQYSPPPPPSSAPPEYPTEEPSPDTQGQVDAFQSALQTINDLGASSGTSSSCDPRGSYGGLFGSPPECYVGSDSIIIPGEVYSTAPDGDAGSSTFGGYVYMPPMLPVLPGQERIAEALSQIASPWVR